MLRCYRLFFQIGCLVSSLLMLAFRASENALWMGTSTFGLFMSNVFPTSVALAEQYFNVTGLSWFYYLRVYIQQPREKCLL